MATEKLKLKIKIGKWNKSFIRDRWGNLTNCYWNKMVKEEILKLETQLKE
jgi:hypothetical protein